MTVRQRERLAEIEQIQLEVMDERQVGSVAGGLIWEDKRDFMLGRRRPANIHEEINGCVEECGPAHRARRSRNRHRNDRA